MRLVRLLSIFLVFGSAVACAQETTPIESARTISVTGMGIVSVSPDLLKLNLVVEAREPKLKEAKQSADKAYASLLDMLKSLGVEERALELEHLEMTPVYERDRYQPSEEVTKYRRVLAGFKVVRYLSLEIDTSEQLSVVLEEVTALKNTSVQGIVRDIRDRKSLRDQASILAAEDARVQANLIAEQFDKQLGDVIKVSIQNFYAPRPHRIGYVASADSYQRFTPQEQLGETEVSASIEVVFELN